MHASELQTKMGTGWQVIADSHPMVVDLVLRAAELTAALDQTHRAGRNCIPFSQLSLLIGVFQHDIYDLNIVATNSESTTDSRESIYQISRLSLQIYSEVVFFPAPEPSRVRERLAEQLRRALTLYLCMKPPGADDVYQELIQWATIMGTVASEATRHRMWYLRQVRNIIIEDSLTWKQLESSLFSFLWWDYTFEEHVLDIWNNAQAFAEEEKVFTANASTDDSQGSFRVAAACSNRAPDD